MIKSSKFCNKYMKSGLYGMPVIDLSLLDKHTLHQLRYLQKKTKNWNDYVRQPHPEYLDESYLNGHPDALVEGYLDKHPTFAHRMGLMSFAQYTNFMQDQADKAKRRGDTDSYSTDVDSGLNTMYPYSVFISPRTHCSNWVGGKDGMDADSLLDQLRLEVVSF